ncbi:hypothetical protein AURDEDRAFT_165857 [Auricularia subglabra TFB-10046 SS5]|nr:hypothetical protein AURDEDRAFT_165857 [Auricularia subglabra TFB-10046 SS5]
MPTPSTTVGLGLHPRRLQGPPLVYVSRALLCRPAASHVVSADIHPRRRPEHVLCSHPRLLHTNALGVTADVPRQAPPMGGPTPMPLADLRRAKPPPPLLSFELVDAQSSLVWAYRTACNLAPRLPAPSKLDGHRRTLADAC